MLFSEFVENVGCKENAHNFKVYQNLEVMYMNSDISKEAVYEYGKKLVDNDVHEIRVHTLPWLVVRDIASLSGSYVAAAFLIKEAADSYIQQFRPVGDYKVIHKDDLAAEYVIIEDKI